MTGTVSQTDYTDSFTTDDNAATVAGKLTLAESRGTTPATGAITLQIVADTIDEVPETLIVTLTKVTTEAGTVVIDKSRDSVTTTVLPAVTKTVSFASACCDSRRNCHRRHAIHGKPFRRHRR